MPNNYDFCGWATKNNLKCSDGRMIMQDAFAECDGSTVPLIYSHDHKDQMNVLGHALLENRKEGVYAYGYFNNTPAGKNAKLLVEHGDITSMSIYANHLKQKSGNVMHGIIREVSLVLAGANPGAKIEYCPSMSHSEEDEEEFDVIIHSGESFVNKEDDDAPKEIEHGVKQISVVYDAMTDEQKTVVKYFVKKALENDQEDEEMKQNAFENDNEKKDEVLSHDEMRAFAADVVKDIKKYGSLKESYLAHAEEYGIKDINFLFPEDRNLNDPPEFISRDMGWVSKVMGAVHHTPFSRVKTMFADITEDEARARGYIKGKLKKEEVFSLLKRAVSPTTVYKKQKLDRDDMIDITDFDAIPWLKKEMRMMLDEELARAFLIGDGRLASSDDKINEANIIPVLNDADLFTIRYAVAAGANDDEKAKNFIRAAIKSRKLYKGSGNVTLFTTEDMLTDMLLLEDGIGHKLYKTEAELATALRASSIVTVPVMEGLTDKDNKAVYGILVNLADYNVGADKGGAVSMFDDFDIDYNQQKYLIETRCSGALVKPFSAIVLRAGTESKSEAPSMSDAMAEFKPVNE